MRYLFLLLLLFGCGYEITKKEDSKKDDTNTQPNPETPTAPSPTPPTNQPDNGGGFPNIPGFPKIPGIPDIPNIPGFPPMPGGGGDDSVVVPPSGDTLEALAAEINAARKSRGLSEVKVETALNCAAKRHADDIGVKKICGHYGSDGSSPWDRAKDCGTSADGEIVACGQGSPKAAVDAWTLSPGHAAIMYAPNQTVVGVGMLNNYWVAIFR